MSPRLTNTFLAAAIVFGFSPATAADDFAALSGVPAESMSQSELAAVAGAATVIRVICFSCGGASDGTTELRTATFDNGGARADIVGALTPHPVFPGTTNPAGRLTGWSGGL